MGLRSLYARLSKRAKIATTCGGILATYALLGFVVIPAVIRWKLPSILHESTGRTARIETVRLNPFALSLTARGFVMDDLDGRPLAAFDELYVNFELSSLYQRAYTFQEVSLLAPVFHLSVLADGRLSIADLIESGEELPAEDDEEAETGLVPLIFRSLHLDHGRFVFDDRSKQPAFALEVGPIDVNLQDFVTVNENGAPYRFKAVTADDQSIEWEGEISASPLRSSGRLAVVGIRPRNAWSYFRDRLAVEIKSGTVDVSAGYRFDAGGEDLVLTLDDGAVAVHGLEIVTAAGGEPVLALPGLQVAGVSFDLGAQRVNVGSITSSGAHLECALEADGAFSYVRLFAVGGASADDSPDEVGTAADPVGEAEASAVEPAAPWNVVVDTIAIDGVSVGFADQTTDPQVALELQDLGLRLDAVTIAPGAEIGLSLETSFGRAGRIQASGRTVLQPLDLALDLDLSEIELATFQPYVDPVASVEIERGSLSLKGALTYRAEHPTSPMLTYRGRLTVDDLATKDRKLGADLAAWNDLRLEGIDLDVEPTSVRVETIAFAQPRVRLVIAEDGTVNLANLAGDTSTEEPASTAPDAAGESEAEQAARAAGDPSVPISVGSFEIDGGAITIVDRTVRPPFRLNVGDLTGSIRDIASDTASRSTVDLRADVGGGAPIAISGSSNLLAADAFTDLTFSLRDVGMTEFSPYSGKYVGRAIEKGKLSLDLQYKLDQSTLVGSNQIRIDQFDFGRNVDSADATSLPVGLAVALLRDTSGRIKIDLPVSGNTDDPEFSLGSVLLGAVVNLVTKAAASPFAIIGGIVGLDAEDLEFVAFPAGGAELTAAEQAKLDALAQALAERPSLRLEIQGVAAPAADIPAVRERALDARLRAARFEEIRGKRDAPVTADEVVLDEDQTFEQLEHAYRQTFDRKPKTLLDEMPAPESGAEPVDENEWLREQMRLRLLDAIAVAEDDLRDLANRRSGAIRGYLTDSGAVAPERIFLRDGNLSEKASGDQVRSKLALAAS